MPYQSLHCCSLPCCGVPCQDSDEIITPTVISVDFKNDIYKFLKITDNEKNSLINTNYF